MARHRFSQKTNGRICFVCFFTLHDKQIKFVRSFFWRIYGSPICFLKLTDLYEAKSRLKSIFFVDDLLRPLIAQSAIVEQLMMMVISKMAMAASFQVNPRKPLWINWLCSFVWPVREREKRLHIIMKIVSLTSNKISTE